jgi:Leucine-rich repeat (LRR) protein
MVRSGAAAEVLELEYKDSVRHHRRDPEQSVPEVEAGLAASTAASEPSPGGGWPLVTTNSFAAASSITFSEPCPGFPLVTTTTMNRLSGLTTTTPLPIGHETRNHSLGSSTGTDAPSYVSSPVAVGHSVDDQRSSTIEWTPSDVRPRSNVGETSDSALFLPDSKSLTFGSQRSDHVRPPDCGLIVLAIVVIVIGAVVGGLCGDGNCGGPPLSPANTTLEYFLRNASLLSEADRQDTVLAKAEDRALQFLLNVSSTKNIPTSLQKFHLRQRFALLNFYFALQMDSKTWNNFTGWLTDSDECSWYGVDCQPQDFSGNPDFSDAGTELVVRSLRLPENGIKGRLSPNVCILNYLSYFNVSHNQIVGSISSGLHHCRNMIDFSVNDNDMSGTVPESIGESWSNLEKIDVGSNAFYGPVPSTIGLWGKVLEFSIANNSFSGTIPEAIANWKNLRVARFANNNALTASLPNEFCQLPDLASFVTDIHCPCCIEAYIQSVAESGGSFSSQTVEAEVTAMQWLMHNDTALPFRPGNAFDEFRLRQRYALLALYFSTQNASHGWSEATGWMEEPDECIWYGVSCSMYDLGGVLGNQSAVDTMSLSDNALSGKLSPDLSMLSSLKYIYLSFNQLSGTLSSAFEKWTNLAVFDVRNNTLKGTIPESYGNLNELTFFDIETNSITGPIPDRLCRVDYVYADKDEVSCYCCFCLYC